MRSVKLKLLSLCAMVLMLGGTPVVQAQSSNKPYITAGVASDTSGYHLIWTPTKVFQNFSGPGFYLSADEITTSAGGSIAGLQGIVCDASGNHFIWTPTKVFYHVNYSTTASEITSAGASIGSVQGIVYDTMDRHLIWTPTKVFSQFDNSTSAVEITSGGVPIGSVQGIACDALGHHLIWTPTGVFYQFYLYSTADEITSGGVPIGSVQGIVCDSMGDHLIWTPTRVFYQFYNDWNTAAEITSAGVSIGSVQGIVCDTEGDNLIWTPTRVFWQDYSSTNAVEITFNDGSIGDVQGIVCDELSGEVFTTHLIWTPTKVFYQAGDWTGASEVTSHGASIGSVQGIVCDDVCDRFIWTPTKVFYQRCDSTTAVEVTSGGASIGSVQGIYDRLIWTTNRGFRLFYNSTSADEITVAGASIGDVQGIVGANSGDDLIWTPTRVLFHSDLADTAAEISSAGGSICSYDPNQVHIVQVFIHHAGSTTAPYGSSGLSGAGIVGKPTLTPVAYPGLSTAAAVVPSSTSPSSHSTVLGAAASDNTALILGPDPVPGVVSGNSMIVLAYPNDPSILQQPTNTTVNQGSTVTFSVTATGFPPLTYQWTYNGTPISGETNSTLVLSNVQPSAQGNYAVMVTNAYGTVTSWVATLRLIGAIPTVSEWGLIVMGLLLLTVGTIFLLRHRGVTAVASGG